MTEAPRSSSTWAGQLPARGGPVRTIGDPPRPGEPLALLVAPSFFGYEIVMAEAMRTAGPAVALLDERPSNTVLGRGLARVRPEVMRTRIKRHYTAAAEQLEGVRLDTLVIVKGEVMPRSFVARLLDRQPHLRVVYYAYDTLRPDDNYFSFADLVDNAFSFDPSDVLRRPELRYRPLFFAPEFSDGPAHADRRFDATMIGTVNPERYERSMLVKATGASMSMHLYTPSRTYLRARSLVDRQYARIDRSLVTSQKLSRADVAAAFRSSRVVVDVQKRGQDGLTMRTLEALAAGAHLLTWNSMVTREPFFDPRRIQVVQEDTPEAVSAAMRRLLLHEHDGRAPVTGFSGYSALDWARDVLEP